MGSSGMLCILINQPRICMIKDGSVLKRSSSLPGNPLWRLSCCSESWQVSWAELSSNYEFMTRLRHGVKRDAYSVACSLGSIGRLDGYLERTKVKCRPGRWIFIHAFACSLTQKYKTCFQQCRPIILILGIVDILNLMFTVTFSNTTQLSRPRS
jgi:hypothetical protein